jgi:hypothetical protein
MADKLGIYGFIRLSMDERANYTWQVGAFLHNRKGEGFNANLYGVEDYYVEVLYDTERNAIVDVLPFKSLDLLNPYLDTIDLGGLD